MRGEDVLQAAIVRFLELGLRAESYLCTIPNGFRKSRAVTEIARAGGRLASSQKTAADAIGRGGGAYAVVRSIDEVAACFEGVGIGLRRRVPA